MDVNWDLVYKYLITLFLGIIALNSCTGGIRIRLDNAYELNHSHVTIDNPYQICH